MECDMRLQASELKLADTVDLGGYALWSNAIVKQVTEKEITFFRPYGTHADFSYTGGVICYVGIEEFSVPRDSRTFRVLRREDLL